MPEPTNPLILPPTENRDNEVHEVVSQVQPPSQRFFTASKIVSFFVLLLVVSGFVYVVRTERPRFGSGIKVAKAPEVIIDSTGTEVSAEPRVSSITTTEPSKPVAHAATQDSSPSRRPAVAGTSTGNDSRVYQHSTGFSVFVPAGTTVSEGGAVLERVVAFYGASGKLLAVVHITGFVLPGITDLGQQLALSPSVQSLQILERGGYYGYTYTQEGIPAQVLVRGGYAYYFIDYSGKLSSSFRLR